MRKLWPLGERLRVAGFSSATDERYAMQPMRRVWPHGEVLRVGGYARVFRRRQRRVFRRQRRRQRRRLVSHLRSIRALRESVPAKPRRRQRRQRRQRPETTSRTPHGWPGRCLQPLRPSRSLGERLRRAGHENGRGKSAESAETRGQVQKLQRGRSLRSRLPATEGHQVPHVRRGRSLLERLPAKRRLRGHAEVARSRGTRRRATGDDGGRRRRRRGDGVKKNIAVRFRSPIKRTNEREKREGERERGERELKLSSYH